MASLKEYLKYYKDLSFQETPLNDVDSMIFTQLVYADFKDVIPKEKGNYILFSDAMRLFLKKYNESKKVPRFLKEVYSLIDILKNARRYENIKLYYYIKMVDAEKQFCAFTLRFDGKVYVAFEGTDTSIIGWKEDFMLTNTFPVPAQRFAIQYLNNTVGFFDKEVYIGGHSKGGNLAMTSAMLSSTRVRMKIKNVYNFDGPGFRRKEFESSSYRRMEQKLRMFVPEDSTIGMLLLHTSNYHVVKSTASGVWQHDPFRWECFGGIFVPGNLSNRSKSLEKSNLDFISSLNDQERSKIIEVVFSVFDKLGITDTSQIKLPKLNQAITLVKEIQSIDSEIRKKIITLLKIMVKGM